MSFLVIKGHDLKITLLSHSFYFNSLYFVNYLSTNKLIQELSTKEWTRQSLTSGDFRCQPGTWAYTEMATLRGKIYRDVHLLGALFLPVFALSRLYSHRYMRKRDHKSTFRSKTEVRERWKKDSLRNSHHWSCLFPNFLLLNTPCFSLLTWKKKVFQSQKTFPH